MKHQLIILLLLSLVLTSACDTRIDNSTNQPVVSVSDVSEKPIAAYIISPRDGDVLSSPVNVIFGLKGMGVAPAGAMIEDTGHHHLLVDMQELPDLSMPLPASDKLIHFGKGQTQTLIELAKGSHTLQLVLGDFAHRPHAMPVISEKNFYNDQINKAFYNMPHTIHHETHRIQKVGWLRAAVLGANDGIVSTASLILGIAAANADSNTILIAGTAGLVAGAMSMAAGEYVSVSSQADTENADLAKEAHELEHNTEFERQELKQIYVGRGLSDELADEVATQLMDHDAIGAHARDELGIFELTTAKPMQAAITSAIAFAIGAALPLIVAALSSVNSLNINIPIASLLSLAGLGIIAAKLGGAPISRSITRIVFWGGGAMILTHLVGKLVGTVL